MLEDHIVYQCCTLHFMCTLRILHCSKLMGCLPLFQTLSRTVMFVFVMFSLHIILKELESHKNQL